MRSFLAVSVFAVCAAGLFLAISKPAAEADTEKMPPPVFRRATAFARSRPLREIPERTAIRPSVIPVETRGFDPQTTPASRQISNEEARPKPAAFGDPMAPPLLSFDGLADEDNVNAYGLLVFPPDANGDIGPGHYVQSANSL